MPTKSPIPLCRAASRAGGPENRLGSPINRCADQYHRDEQGDWVAEFECGHCNMCVTIRPGLTAWGTTPEGRKAKLGQLLNCRSCNAEQSTSVVLSYIPDDSDGVQRSRDTRHTVSTLPSCAIDLLEEGGGVAGIQHLRALPVPEPLNRSAARRAQFQVLKRVAKVLRNTPAVCRKSYVNSQLFVAWEKGTLARHFQQLKHLRGRRGERALVRFMLAN